MAKPKARRAIIREWMALTREKRQTGQQALAFAKSRDPTAQPAAQPPNGSRRDYGMAAVTHRTTLICGVRLPGGCECVLGCQWRKAAVRKRTGSSCAGLCTQI